MKRKTSGPINSVKDVLPSSYMDYKLFLKAFYAACKAIDQHYTYQRFAEDLGFEATTIMHQLIQGYRPLTAKTAKKIVPHLHLAAGENGYFLALVAFSNSKTSAERELHFKALQDIKRETLPDEVDRDLLEYFANWYNPVIWELVGLSDFQSDPDWIGKKIVPHLKSSTVQESLDLLLRLNLIAVDAETQKIVQTKDRVTTGHRIKGLALLSYHASMIEHGKRALIDVPGAKRDMSAMTVSVDQQGFEKLRAMVHAFQLQILDEAERCGAGDRIYQLNIQLFPFSE